MHASQVVKLEKATRCSPTDWMRHLSVLHVPVTLSAAFPDFEKAS